MGHLHPARPASILAKQATDQAHAFSARESVDAEAVAALYDEMQRRADQANAAAAAWHTAAAEFRQLMHPDELAHQGDRGEYAQRVFEETTRALWATDRLSQP